MRQITIKRGQLFKIRFQVEKDGPVKDYELCFTAISKLTGRSGTFLRARLEEGMSMQEAVDAIPRDPALNPIRGLPRARSSSKNKNRSKEKAEDKSRKKHRDLLHDFFRRPPCSTV